MKYRQDVQDIRQFLRDKDAHSCRSLVSRHQNAVFRTCFGVLKDLEVAEEVAQDVFIKAFDRLTKLDDPAKFRAWILRIAYSSAIDHWRRQKKPLVEEANQTMVDPAMSPDEKLDLRQQSEAITNAINKLGEPDTSIFTLFYLEEMKISEISEILQLSDSNIKIRLMRGRKQLKKTLSNIIKHF